MDFFNDISKEITKDIVGQKIYYYQISFDKTKVHPVYEEAMEKVFEKPVEINCVVDWQPSEVHTSKFGQDYKAKIKVYVQSRDLIQKEIEIKDGSFFSYGLQFFEITSVETFKNIYGQVEYDSGVMISGIQTRKDVFSTKAIGPTSEGLSDEDAVQETFVQQRGFAENQEGPTGDQRDLVKKGVLEPPLPSEPAEVSKRGTTGDVGNGFYGEGDS
jgi:hypothetical protein